MSACNWRCCCNRQFPHTGLMEVYVVLFLFLYSHPISQAECQRKSLRALAFMRRKPSTILPAFPDQPLVFGFIMTHNNSRKIASCLGIQSLQPSRDFVVTCQFCYQDNLLYSVILVFIATSEPYVSVKTIKQYCSGDELFKINWLYLWKHK